MSQDFENMIATRTEHKEPPRFMITRTEQPLDAFTDNGAPEPDDFQDPLDPLAQEPRRQAPPRPMEPPRKAANPQLTAKVLVSLYNNLQELGYTTAHKRILKKQLFAAGEFDQAKRIQITPAQPAADDDDAKKKQDLAKRYQQYLQELKSRTAELELDEQEQKLLIEPLEQLAELYPGLDLGPGWSLVIGLAIVNIPRIVALKS